MVGARAAWMKAGISARQFRTLVSSGELVRLSHGAYATRQAMTWARDNPRRTHVLYVYTAMQKAGKGSVASHQSAAVMHDLDLLKHPGKTVALSVPPARRHGSRAGVTVHNTPVPERHVRTMYQVPVTSPVRTVADLARTLPFMEAVVVADSAFRMDLASAPEVLRALEDCSSWPGVRQAERAVEFADSRAESVFESCARVVFAQAGLGEPVLQHGLVAEGRRYRVDFYYAKHRTVVEADGLLKYETKSDLRRQFERDRHLRAAGYKVVHVTWRELFDAPEIVIDRIRTAFAAGSAY